MPPQLQADRRLRLGPSTGPLSESCGFSQVQADEFTTASLKRGTQPPKPSICLSKRGNDGPPSVKDPGNSMMRRLEASPFLTVLAALFVVVFAASGVRLVIPGMREQTRAPNNAAVRSPADRGKRATRRRSTGIGTRPKDGPLARLVRALVRHLPRLTPEYPQPELPTLVATACGTSLPKRLRWKALGGHGRNGPGL